MDSMDTTAHTTPANRGQLSRQEMETKMDNEEITPREIGHPSEILLDEINGETVNAHVITQWAHHLNTAESHEDTRRVIQWLRDYNRTITRDRETAQTRERYLMRQRDSLDSTLYRDRQHLARALEQLHGDQPPYGYDNPVWGSWLRVAYASGILHGYANEAHRLAEYLAEDFGDQAREIWREVAGNLRGSDGAFPEPVSVEEAVASAVTRYALGAVHASDPRLSQGWRKVWGLAKQADLCEVFDTLATAVGVPQQEFTKSGMVSVSFYATANVWVEGVEGDDLDGHLDMTDVMEGIDRYSIDIQEIDDSELTVDDD